MERSLHHFLPHDPNITGFNQLSSSWAATTIEVMGWMSATFTSDDTSVVLFLFLLLV